MAMIKHFSVALLSASITVAAHAGDFKIKNIEIGMSQLLVADYTRCESYKVLKCFGSSPPITVGGVDIESALFYFNEIGEATQIHLSFKSSEFAQIKAAFTSKYRSIKCKQNEVFNGFGAKFIDEVCESRTKNERISISKFGSSTTLGSVLLVSEQKLIDDAKAMSEKAKDI